MRRLPVILALLVASQALAQGSSDLTLRGGLLSSSGTAQGTDFRLTDSAVARRFSINLLPIQSESFRFMPGSLGSRSLFGLPPFEVTGLVLARGDRRCTVGGNNCTSDVDCTAPEEACVFSAQLEWFAESSSSSYNLYRSGVAPHSTCRWANLVATSFVDYEGNPDPESVLHYLVSGKNIWGESVLGSRSDGTVRPNDEPCP